MNTWVSCWKPGLCYVFPFSVKGEFLQILLCQKRAHFISGRRKMMLSLLKDPEQRLSLQLIFCKTSQGRQNSKDGLLGFPASGYPNTNLGVAVMKFCRYEVQGQVTLRRGDCLGGLTQSGENFKRVFSGWWQKGTQRCQKGQKNMTHHCCFEDRQGHVGKNVSGFQEQRVPAAYSQHRWDLRPTASRKWILPQPE